MARIKVKVVPGSSRDLIVGWLGESLKIKVKAPPEQGKANLAVIRLLASQFGIDRSRITINSGHSSSTKTLIIADLENSQILSLLKDFPK